MFKGCGTALVTPFKSDLSLDEATLRKLVQRQISEGIDFLVPCGTTGESPTLSFEEHLRVVEITIEEAKGKVPVLAGAGGYDTHHVIQLGLGAKKLGADGILSVTPYYNKPTPEGIFQHYKAIAKEVDLPIILYNIVGRTGTNIDPNLMMRLTEIPQIVGVKEASGNIQQMAALAHRLPTDFLLLSGDDAITIPLISLGGHGLISVVSNEIPRQMTELVRLAVNGDFEGARKIQRDFLALMDINFIESNPGPAKVAMEMMGLLEANYRLPMVRPQQANVDKIGQVLSECGLLEERSMAGAR